MTRQLVATTEREISPPLRSTPSVEGAVRYACARLDPDLATHLHLVDPSRWANERAPGLGMMLALALAVSAAAQTGRATLEMSASPRDVRLRLRGAAVFASTKLGDRLRALCRHEGVVFEGVGTHELVLRWAREEGPR
ncbi:MAG: hypothetical protein KF901_11090 [Myxococcales bacterium]|nr:hypothetical protein [Myxococcales bacterium]